MIKSRTKIRSRISKHVEKSGLLIKRLPESFKLIILVAVFAVGYIAGTYNYQISAVMRPIFNLKTISTDTLDLSSLQKTYQELSVKFDGKLDKQELINGAKAGMVGALGDPYTVYMNKEESSEFDKALSGNIGAGIGAEIGLRGGNVTIIRVLADNAAIKAGLLGGDTILKINDESTIGFTVDKAVKLIRGEQGTTVKLTVLRGSETKEFTVTRAVINNPSVYSSVSGTVGIITITRFDSETGNLAKNAARSLKTQGVKSIVLDLRDNGGGYVDAAVDVAGLWIEDKVIVTERIGDKVKETLKSGKDAILGGMPTIVVVNGGSASASEIVAGALQDYKAAKLVGVKTFGKGSVQELITLDDGSTLKVTIARWYTPEGKNINKDGIVPEYVVEMNEDSNNTGVDAQLDKAKSLLNS